MSPMDFLHKIVKFPIDDYVLVANYPHSSKPFNKLYTVDYVNNMSGESNSYKFVNLPIESVKTCCQKSLEHKKLVWFCADISKDSNYSLGILDKNVMDYSNIFDMEFIQMDKGSRMIYKNAQISHAMIFRGFHSKKKGSVPEKWLVENSWGEDTGKKGRYVMSNQWFEDHVFCVAVHKKFLESSTVKTYNKPTSQSIQLAPWDIFGHATIL